MQIEVEGVGLVEFPDDATQDEIADALNRDYPAQQAGPNLGEILRAPEIPTPQLYAPGMPYGVPSPQATTEPTIWRDILESRQEGVPSSAGITSESIPSGRRLTEMVVGAPPELAEALRQEVPTMSALDVPMTVASSAAKTGIGLTEYLSSPQGITELVASLTPAKVLVLGKWAIDMAGGAYQEGKELGALLKKQNKTPEDWQAISDRAVNAVAMAVGTIGAGRGAFKEVKSLAQKLGVSEGKIPVTDRTDLIRSMEDEVVTRRQAQEGSPFVTAEAPREIISQGFRTQPPLGTEPTFEPSGLKTTSAVQAEVKPTEPPPTIEPPPIPQKAPVQIGAEATRVILDFPDEDWNVLVEKLIDDSDTIGSSGARETGKINYELKDEIQNFMDSAREEHADVTIAEAWKEYRKESEASERVIRNVSRLLRENGFTGKKKSLQQSTTAPKPEPEIQKGGETSASEIRSTEAIPQREVWPQVGQETPLRQSGESPKETPGVQEVNPPLPQSATAPVPSLFIKEGKRLAQITPAEASEVMARIRDKSGRGASTLGELKLYDANGKQIAFVSYNGNVWLGTSANRVLGKYSMLHNATGLVWDEAGKSWDFPKPPGWDKLTKTQDDLDAIRNKPKNKNKTDVALAAENPEFARLILQRDKLIDASLGTGKSISVAEGQNTIELQSGIPLPKVGVQDLSTQKALGAYSPVTGSINLDANTLKTLTRDQRANVVRHEIAHKIETESKLWEKSDTYLWRLWEKNKYHPIFDWWQERGNKREFNNSVSPEIVATLYAENFESGIIETFNPRTGKTESHPIPKPLMDVLKQIDDKVLIYKKRQIRASSQNTIELHSGIPFPTVPEAVKSWARRNLTAQHGLPTDVFNKWSIGRGGYVKEQMNLTAHKVRNFYRGLAKAYGIGFGERAVKGFSGIDPAEVRLLNSYLRGEIPVDQLRPEVRASISDLRAHIDSLSNTMIQEGLVSDRLQLTISENLGAYLNRSYRVFDDPKWSLDKLDPANQQRVVAGMLDELRRDNPQATIQDALNTIEAVVNEYKRKGEMETLFGKGATLGSKNLSLFMKRQDISDWWRAMMGEYETPVINYVKSISKMSRFIADQRFLREVEQAGRGTFLFEQPTTGHTSRIAAAGNAALEPISKYYTTEEIAKAFREFYDQPAKSNPVWKFIMGVTYASKAAKTVGSWMTQARNLLSQPFFWLRNGHWDVRQAWPSVRSVYADIVGKEGAFQDYYRDAVRHGVANDTAQVGELRSVMADVIGPRDFDVPTDLLAGRSIAKTIKRGTVDVAERLYRTSDEIGKLVGWEIEKWYERNIHPEWSEAQVKVAAAQRVRNLYPTYSMISRFVSGLGKQPVFGPFISFPAEIMRTSYWAGKYTIEGLKSNNPMERYRAAKLLVGQTAAYGATFALGMAIRQLFNVTEQQDSDIRRFLPAWSKNAQLLYLGPIKDGKAEYINLSYLNPYSYFADPMVAVMALDDKNYEEKFYAAVSEFFRPFTSEQMTANAVVDLMRNQTELGRRVYNPEDDTKHKVSDAAKHLWEPIEPGTLTRFRRRGLPALRGEQPTTGLELSPVREFASEITGIKAEGNDFKTAIGQKLRKFIEAENNVENIWRSKLMSGGIFTPEAIAEEYQRMEQLRKEAWSEFRGDVEAAIRLGLSDQEVDKILRAGGITSETRRKIFASDYRPYSPAPELLKKAIERGRDIPEAMFENDVESRLKLIQAKAEVSGDSETAARAKKLVGKLEYNRSRMTKIEDSPDISKEERDQVMKALQQVEEDIKKFGIEDLRPKR